MPRDVYSNEEREAPQQGDEGFNQMLNPDQQDYTTLTEVLNDGDNMDYQEEHNNNYPNEYQYSPHWSYSDADPSNTNLGIHHSMSYSNAKDDTEHNTDNMDGSYPY